MVKIGDIVYYDYDGVKRYCRCVAITELRKFKGTKQIWGDWSEYLEEVKKLPITKVLDPVDTGTYTYMDIDDVEVIKQSLKSLLEE